MAPTCQSTRLGEAVAAAASGPDSRGFFHVHSVGCCGGEEHAYLFKRGGWEYAVSTGYSRNVNPDIAAELGDYSDWQVITVTSPDGGACHASVRGGLLGVADGAVADGRWRKTL